MLNKIHQVLPPRKLAIPFVGLLLTLGFVGNQAKPVLSSEVERISTKIVAIVPGSQASISEASPVPRGNFPAKDGIYLYGQSPKPNQAGQGYIVFQKQQGKVSGAMYMPQSEFSCFQGTLEPSGELAMTVDGSPDEASSNEVATANKLPKFADDESSSYAYSVALQDYHQLSSVSASDRRILQMCNSSSAASNTKFVK